jgi:hypothetical protein
VAEQAGWLRTLARCDFGAAAAAIVTTVPGLHRHYAPAPGGADALLAAVGPAAAAACAAAGDTAILHCRWLSLAAIA